VSRLLRLTRAAPGAAFVAPVQRKATDSLEMNAVRAEALPRLRGTGFQTTPPNEELR
jgi:hypothetical protein